tara:strand:+ start:461 stop:649 length:189 start_codon:yes stop_codon:yes gene_type:complete
LENFRATPRYEGASLSQKNVRKMPGYSTPWQGNGHLYRYSKAQAKTGLKTLLCFSEENFWSD